MLRIRRRNKNGEEEEKVGEEERDEKKNTHISVLHSSCDLLEGFPPGNDGHAPLSEVVFE